MSIDAVLDEVLSGGYKRCSNTGCSMGRSLQPIENFYLLSDNSRSDVCVSCTPRSRVHAATLEVDYGTQDAGLREWFGGSYTDEQKSRARYEVAENLPPARIFRCVFCGLRADEWHHLLGYGDKFKLTVLPVCVSCHKLADKARKTGEDDDESG